MPAKSDKSSQRGILGAAGGYRLRTAGREDAAVGPVVGRRHRAGDGRQVARRHLDLRRIAGEPPTRRGYPPSVFAALPKLMERAGQSDKGSITALYTVLVEGDDMTEPVADETRSILDGHIILSRKLAAMNHYPAIDVLRSASRVMNQIVEPDHQASAAHLREMLAKYEEVELLLKIGEYQHGADSRADMAIAQSDDIRAFLRQGTHEPSDLDGAIAQLKGMANQ